MPIQEREEKRADVRTVDVGVCRDDYLVITKLGEIEYVPYGRAERNDKILYLLRSQHLVEACTLDVQYLAAQRQNGLNAPVATHFSGAAGRIALHDK